MKNIFIVIIMIVCVQLKSVAQDINIAFTIDKNYPVFTQIVIFSILENNLSQNHYNFYIVEDNLTKKQKSEIYQFVKKRKHDVSFIHVSTDQIDNGINFYDNLFIGGRISRIGMARLLLPKILPSTVHRVIYLDSDILVSKDIAKLYNTNLKKNPIGMTIDYSANNSNIYNSNVVYNSGVIVMDVDMWRKEKITEKIIKYFHENIDLYLSDQPKYYCPDQDLLNIVLKNRITALQPKWNVFAQEQADVLQGRICIYHYIGTLKPWYFPKKETKAYNLYYDYWNKSPLRKYKLFYYFKYRCLPIIIQYLY